MKKILNQIKDECELLPSAEEVFYAARNADEIEDPKTAQLSYGYIHKDFDQFIEKFKKP